MILGIDPGLENTGWGVIQAKSLKLKGESDNDYELVECGVILTKKVTDSSYRLKQIYSGLAAILTNYDIETVALERLFFAKNVKSMSKVAEAIGVIKVCSANYGKRVVEYTPLQVKLGLVGYGRAEKEQVEMMVRTLLHLEKPISPSHASDAVAVALTAGMRSELEEAVVESGE